MKEKVFDYIEELERKAKESEKYFKLWHEEKIKNKKAIEYIEENCTECGEGKWAYRTINADNTLNILNGVDKE